MNSLERMIWIYVPLDDYCKQVAPEINSKLLGRKRNRPPKLSEAAIVAIVVCCHPSGFKNFKAYYQLYVQQHMSTWFEVVSYNRFIALMKRSMYYLYLFAAIQVERPASTLLTALRWRYVILNELLLIKYLKQALVREKLPKAGSSDLNCT